MIPTVLPRQNPFCGRPRYFFGKRLPTPAALLLSACLCAGHSGIAIAAEADGASATISDRNRIENYCTTLDMAAVLCERVNRFVFTNTDPNAPTIVWPVGQSRGYQEGEGEERQDAVVSPTQGTGLGNHSCMSIHFDLAIGRGASYSFYWRLGRDSKGDEPSKVRVFFGPLPDDHVPEFEVTPGRSRQFGGSLPTSEFFSNWEQITAATVGRDIDEIKWCYFGGNPTPGSRDQVHIDRLSITPVIDRLETADRTTIGEYCTALSMPPGACRYIDRMIFSGTMEANQLSWNPGHRPGTGAPSGGDVALASPPTGKDHISCLELQFNPPIRLGSSISVQWTLGQSAGADQDSGIRMWFGPATSGPPIVANHVPILAGPGRSRQYRGVANRTNNFASWEQISLGSINRDIYVLKWCYFGGHQSPGAADIIAIDALQFNPVISLVERADRTTIEEYCQGMNISAAVCQRTSGVAFSSNLAPDQIIWSPDDSLLNFVKGSNVAGTDRVSVYSPAIGQNNFGCFSLYFDPPIAMGSDISFAWSFGTSDYNQRRGDDPNGMQVWVNPAIDHFPQLNTGSAQSIHGQSASSFFFDWATHSIPDVSSDVAELKWCFFGRSARIDPRFDRGFVDRFTFGPTASEIAPGSALDEYCSALNTPPETCERLARIVFTGTLGPQLDWSTDYSPTPPAPEGGATAMGSPAVPSGHWSCASLHFDPAIPTHLQLSFQWGGLGNNSGATLLLYANPPDNHIPSTADTVGGMTGLWHKNIVTATKLSFEPLLLKIDRRAFGSTAPLSSSKWCIFVDAAAEQGDYRAVLDRFEVRQAPVMLSESTQRNTIENYCNGLDTSAAVCQRIGRVGFSGTIPAEALVWSLDDSYSVPSPQTDDIAVVSPAINDGNFSCMSLHFHPPIAMGSVISFSWSVGENGLDPNRFRPDEPNAMQLWINPPVDHFPLLDRNSDQVIAAAGSNAANFTALAKQNIMAVPSEVAEVKWCFFGISIPNGSDFDRGLIDRFSFAPIASESTTRSAIDKYCSALNTVPEDCAQIDRIVFTGTLGPQLDWSADYSPTPPAQADDTTATASPAVPPGHWSCASMHFNPAIPTDRQLRFQWGGLGGDSGAILHIYADPPADHVPLAADVEGGMSGLWRKNPVTAELTFAAIALLLRQRARGAELPLSELKWCILAAATAADDNYRAVLDRFEIRDATIRVQESTERTTIADYCRGLNTPAAVCQRISRLSFSGIIAADQLPWSVADSFAETEPQPDDTVVSSPPVRQHDFSCISLHFEPAIAMGSDISFAWNIGGSNITPSTGELNAIQLWINPPVDHLPDFDGNSDQTRQRVSGSDLFTGWDTHSIPGIASAAAELKWCYFERAAPSDGDPDRGLIDRFSFAPIASESTTRSTIDEYCSALNTVPEDCAQIARIVFTGTLGPQLDWSADYSPTPQAQAGDATATASPAVPPGHWSCASMHFDPAIPTDRRLRFQWGGLGGDSGATLHIYADPPADHFPLVADVEGDMSGLWRKNPVTAKLAFTAVSLPLNQRTRRAELPLSELKWCVLAAATATDDSYRAVLDRFKIQQGLAVTAPLLIHWFRTLYQCAAEGNAVGGCTISSGEVQVATLVSSVDIPELSMQDLAVAITQLQQALDSGAADVNKDNRYDSRDLRLLMRWLSGLRGEALTSEGNAEELDFRLLTEP